MNDKVCPQTIPQDSNSDLCKMLVYRCKQNSTIKKGDTMFVLQFQSLDVFLASHHWKDNCQIVPKGIQRKHVFSWLIKITVFHGSASNIQYQNLRWESCVFVVCPRLTATDRFLYGFAWRRFVKDCEEVYKTSGKRILRRGEDRSGRCGKLKGNRRSF